MPCRCLTATLVNTLVMVVLLPPHVENMGDNELHQWAIKTMSNLPGAQKLLSQMLQSFWVPTGDVMSSLAKWAHSAIETVTTTVPNLLTAVLPLLGDRAEGAVGLLIVSYLVKPHALMQKALQALYTAYSNNEQAARDLLGLLMGEVSHVAEQILDVAMALGTAVVHMLGAMIGTVWNKTQAKTSKPKQRRLNDDKGKEEEAPPWWKQWQTGSNDDDGDTFMRLFSLVYPGMGDAEEDNNKGKQGEGVARAQKGQKGPEGGAKAAPPSGNPTAGSISDKGKAGTNPGTHPKSR